MVAIFLFASLVTAIPVGCKNETGSASGETTGSGKPALQNSPSARSSSGTPWTLDAASIQTKLQGAWVLRHVSSLGDVQAWEVKGAKVTVYEPKRTTGPKERTLDLVVESPCTLKLSETRPDGATESGFSTFVFLGNALHLGLGDAGVKQGNSVVACGGGGVFVLTGGKCTVHKAMFGRWGSEPATCNLRGDVFKGEAKYRSTSEIKATGDVYVSDQLKSNPATRAASFAEAKSSADALAK
ncbi:MAG: hypothetical protein HYY84_09850 [Deltaproteobacteria bacterium]|nr:hypothetical protein [Deltaproteobacteria bacterium]